MSHDYDFNRSPQGDNWWTTHIYVSFCYYIYRTIWCQHFYKNDLLRQYIFINITNTGETVCTHHKKKNDRTHYNIAGSLWYLKHAQFERFVDTGTDHMCMRHIVELAKHSQFDYGRHELGKKSASAILKGVGDYFAKYLMGFPIIPFKESHKYFMDGDVCRTLAEHNEKAAQYDSVTINSLIGNGLLRAAVIRMLISHNIDMLYRSNTQSITLDWQTEPCTITRKRNWSRACKIFDAVTDLYYSLYTSDEAHGHHEYATTLGDHARLKHCRHIHSPDNLMDALLKNNFDVVGCGAVSDIFPMCSHAIAQRRPVHYGHETDEQLQEEVKIVCGDDSSPKMQKMLEASTLFAEMLDGLGLIAYVHDEKCAYVYTKLQVMEYAQMLLLYTDGVLNTIKSLKAEYGYENKKPVLQFFRILKLALTYYANVVAYGKNSIRSRIGELSKHLPDDARNIVNSILKSFKDTDSIRTPSAVSSVWGDQLDKFVSLMVHTAIAEMPHMLLGRTEINDPFYNSYIININAKEVNRHSNTEHAEYIDRFINRIGHMLFKSDFGPFVKTNDEVRCQAFGALVFEENIHTSLVRYNVHPRDVVAVWDHKIYKEFMARMAQIVDVVIKFESPYSVNSPLFAPELLYRPDILAYAGKSGGDDRPNRRGLRTKNRIMVVPCNDNGWYGAVKVPHYPAVARRIRLENKKFANITSYR